MKRDRKQGNEPRRTVSLYRSRPYRLIHSRDCVFGVRHARVAEESNDPTIEIQWPEIYKGIAGWTMTFARDSIESFPDQRFAALPLSDIMDSTQLISKPAYLVSRHLGPCFKGHRKILLLGSTHIFNRQPLVRSLALP